MAKRGRGKFPEYPSSRQQSGAYTRPDPQRPGPPKVTVAVKRLIQYRATFHSTMSEAVWKVAVNRNFDFQGFAICQNFRKEMNEDVHNFPDDTHSIFFDVQTRL